MYIMKRFHQFHKLLGRRGSAGLQGCFSTSECLTLETQANLIKSPLGIFLACATRQKAVSRLRESFHVLRLSNRLYTLCHTVFRLLSHGHWVHSAENNVSWVVGTRHSGQAQMCQGCWQQRPRGGGGNNQAASLPSAGP